jgi:molybdate transport system substrate-binding protein
VHAEDIRVFAAASLTDVLTELGAVYQKAYPGSSIKTSFAASSTLSKQIENGAPADIFISADLEWGDYLEKRGLLVAASRRNLLGNALVIITPKGKESSPVFDAAFNFANSFSGRLCTGDPAYVPAGKYAKQALTYYHWWKPVQPRLAGTDDVRTALAFVERGECAVGIVYATDAEASSKVSVAGTFPAISHAPIIYPGALVKNSGAEAAEFWQFLQGAAARQVFVRHGFTVFDRQ